MFLNQNECTAVIFPCYRCVTTANILSTASQVETIVMDLLSISYTKESSVLTEGEMSFTLYEITNMANTWTMYYYFETRTT